MEMLSIKIFLYLQVGHEYVLRSGEIEVVGDVVVKSMLVLTLLEKHYPRRILN